jgi:hypothetical protein
MSFVGKLLLADMSGSFGGARLFKCLLKPFLGSFIFGAKLDDRFTLSMEPIERLILREFRVTDLSLQVPHNIICFRERSLSLFACGGFGGQSCFGALQAAAGGGRRRSDAAVRRSFVTLVSSQDSDRNITILYEPAAMQTAIEAFAHTGLIHSFRIRPVA